MDDTHKLAREMEGRGDGGNMDEGGDTPVGEPGNPIDQFLVLVDCIIARRLNLIDASQREWCREFHGRVVCAVERADYCAREATQPFQNR